LKLQDLCCPLFPVDPEPPKRLFSDDRLHQLWDRYAQLSDPPPAEEVNSFLYEISESNVLSLFPEFDLIYVAQAVALARVFRFADAEAVLENAFRKCPVKSALCKALGDTKLWQGDIVAFGWYMQSCLLGYESCLPYLQLAQAAKAIALQEISNCLLNATDIVGGTSMYRLSPPSAVWTTSIAKKDTKTLRDTFETFFRFANSFLPPSDMFPPDDEQKERAIQLILCSGDPEGSWGLAKKKVINRCFP